MYRMELLSEAQISREIGMKIVSIELRNKSNSLTRGSN